MGSRIAIERSNLVIRHLLRLQLGNSFVHYLQLAGDRFDHLRSCLRTQTVNLRLLLGNQERNETRNRIVLDQIRSLSVQYFLRIFYRRFRRNNNRSLSSKITVFGLHTCGCLTFLHTGYDTVLDGRDRRVVNGPGDPLVIRISRLHLSHQRTRSAFNDLNRTRHNAYTGYSNHNGIRVILVRTDIVSVTLRTSHTVDIRFRSSICRTFIHQLCGSVCNGEVCFANRFFLYICLRQTDKTGRVTEVRTILSVVICSQTRCHTRTDIRDVVR